VAKERGLQRCWPCACVAEWSRQQPFPLKHRVWLPETNTPSASNDTKGVCGGQFRALSCGCVCGNGDRRWSHLARSRPGASHLANRPSQSSVDISSATALREDEFGPLPQSSFGIVEAGGRLPGKRAAPRRGRLCSGSIG
jgi:hypothetical protein